MSNGKYKTAIYNYFEAKLTISKEPGLFLFSLFEAFQECKSQYSGANGCD